MRHSAPTMTILLAAILALAACGGGGESAPAPTMETVEQGEITVPEGSPLRDHVEVQAVAASTGTSEISMPAAVEADPERSANILAPLTGRVTSLNVRLGSRVAKGQALATLASGDLLQAYDDDDKAKDALTLAAKALARARGVRAAGGAADKDLEAAQSAYNQAAAEAARASARLAALTAGKATQARELVLSAPFAGVVTALALADGAQVSDPTAALMTVADVSRVFITAQAPEDRSGRIAVGTAATYTLSAYPGEEHRGTVTEVSSALDPTTRRQQVRIEVDNGGGQLLPNMYATVRVALPAAGAVTVPPAALLMNNDAVAVLVEVRPWVFVRRAVTIGDETAQAVRVLSGLKSGERVVVKGGVLFDD
jgi:cobalt-zinc-cadmium efflux system membrane fusion protein